MDGSETVYDTSNRELRVSFPALTRVIETTIDGRRHLSIEWLGEAGTDKRCSLTLPSQLLEDIEIELLVEATMAVEVRCGETLAMRNAKDAELLKAMRIEPGKSVVTLVRMPSVD